MQTSKIETLSQAIADAYPDLAALDLMDAATGGTLFELLRSEWCVRTLHRGENVISRSLELHCFRLVSISCWEELNHRSCKLFREDGPSLGIASAKLLLALKAAGHTSARE